MFIKNERERVRDGLMICLGLKKVEIDNREMGRGDKSGGIGMYSDNIVWYVLLRDKIDICNFFF